MFMSRLNNPLNFQLEPATYEEVGDTTWLKLTITGATQPYFLDFTSCIGLKKYLKKHIKQIKRRNDR